MRIATTCLAALLVPALLGGCASATRITDVGHASPLQTTHAESNRARTERLVEQLISEVRLPKGERSRSSAPTRSLRGPGSRIAGSNLVLRHRWWTSPQGERAVLAYVKHHAPHGCRFDASGTSGGPSGATVYSVLCSAPNTRHTYEPQVNVEAVRYGSGSALRADAEAVWIPRRPASSFIRHASMVRVTVERHASYPGVHREPTVRRTLGASGTARLATVFNRQTVTPPVDIACPADFRGVDDTLIFATPRGDIPVTVNLTGCGGIIVKAPHHPEVDLSGSDAMDAAVRHALHLPRSYAR